MCHLLIATDLISISVIVIHILHLISEAHIKNNCNAK